MERNFGGVAEGIEDAEEEVGGDLLGVAVDDGGDAGARGFGEAGDLSVGEALTRDDCGDFGIEVAAECDFGAVRGG